MSECMYVCDDSCFVVVCSVVLMVVVTLFCVDVTMIPANNIGVEGLKTLVPTLKSLSRRSRSY